MSSSDGCCLREAGESRAQPNRRTAERRWVETHAPEENEDGYTGYKRGGQVSAPASRTGGGLLALKSGRQADETPPHHLANATGGSRRQRVALDEAGAVRRPDRRPLRLAAPGALQAWHIAVRPAGDMSGASLGAQIPLPRSWDQDQVSLPSECSLPLSPFPHHYRTATNRSRHVSLHGHRGLDALGEAVARSLRQGAR
jgi:hypothetical protein